MGLKPEQLLCADNINMKGELEISSTVFLLVTLENLKNIKNSNITRMQS